LRRLIFFEYIAIPYHDVFQLRVKALGLSTT